MLSLPKDPLNDAEFEELDEWLMSDDAPEDCMDISMLDGFSCAIVSGPTVMPSEWLPAVWGSDDDPLFDSNRQANRILSLILRFHNDTAQALQDDPASFEPIFFVNRMAEPPIEIADEWCYGYMRGVELRRADWNWLLRHPQHSKLFEPITAMAYFENEYAETYERIHGDSELFEQTKALIVPSVATIHALWRERLRNAHS